MLGPVSGGHLGAGPGLARFHKVHVSDVAGKQRDLSPSLARLCTGLEYS